MFRRKLPPWVCAWQRTGFHGVQTGTRRPRYARHGAGDTHAVATDGKKTEAVCGQIVRFVGTEAWPPSFGDECADCARITSGERTTSVPTPATDVAPAVRRTPAFAPELAPIELHGRQVRLEPLRTFYAGDLLAAADEDRSTFAYIEVPTTLSGMYEYIETLQARRVGGKELPFAIYDTVTSRFVGVTRYLNAEWGPEPTDAGHWKTPTFLEIGGTWLARSAQRTHVNTEAKLLMLRYAFEQLGVARVSLHTDEDDMRARAAVLRLGAWFEGLRRGHEIGPDGTMRNAAYFSITAIEWPSVRDVLVERLGWE